MGWHQLCSAAPSVAREENASRQGRGGWRSACQPKLQPHSFLPPKPANALLKKSCRQTGGSDGGAAGAVSNNTVQLLLGSSSLCPARQRNLPAAKLCLHTADPSTPTKP